MATLLCAGLSRAQTAAPDDRPPRSPKNDPVLNDPSLERDTATVRPRRGGGPIAPTPPPVVQQMIPSQKPGPLAAGAAQTGLGVPVRTYREGTFLVARRGKVVRGASGAQGGTASEIVFAPTAEDGGPPEPVMTLMPGPGLEEVEQRLGTPGFNGEALLSGQVFVYRGYTYLMASALALPPAAEPAQQSKTTEPAAAPAEPTPSLVAPGTAEPSAEDVIKSMEEKRRGPRALEAPSVEPPDAATTPAEAGAARGTSIIVLRRARLVRMPAGRIGLAFDNDLDSPASRVLEVLPCTQLALMEGMAARSGDAAALRVSGRVSWYRGKEYVLPTVVQSVGLVNGDVVPMQ